MDYVARNTSPVCFSFFLKVEQASSIQYRIHLGTLESIRLINLMDRDNFCEKVAVPVLLNYPLAVNMIGVLYPPVKSLQSR